jgi:TatA/E family protein of Tat protein translocase
MSLGPLEVMVILVVALLLFGPDRLPEMGRTLAKGMKELRKLQDSVKADIDQVMHEAGLKEEAPTYRARPAADDDLDHEASTNGSEAFPADPDAPDATHHDHPTAEAFPEDADAPSANGRPVPKPRTGPLAGSPEIVDIGDIGDGGDGGFPPPGSFS